jgi:hypothetical protein
MYLFKVSLNLFQKGSLFAPNYRLSFRCLSILKYAIRHTEWHGNCIGIQWQVMVWTRQGTQLNKVVAVLGATIALSFASASFAQSGVITKTLFSGKTNSGGTVSGSKGKVTSIKGVVDTRDLAGLSGSNPYTIGYDGSYVSVTNAAKTTTFLKGKVSSTLVNSWVASGSYGPTFALIGTLNQLSGTWYDQIIHSMGTKIKDNRLWGEFSFSGLAAKPSGAENFTLNVSGQAVPEPGEWAAMATLGLGLGGMILRRRRRA